MGSIDIGFKGVVREGEIIIEGTSDSRGYLPVHIIGSILTRAGGI